MQNEHFESVTSIDESTNAMLDRMNDFVRGNTK